jgi:voltage-dependent potassium channel beta subunit
MHYRNLGSSGLKVSEIALGGWLTFGNALEAQNADRVLSTALDLGINFLDSANAYARGACEEVWGKLLKPRRRSALVIATKVFFPMDAGPNDRGLSRKHITEQCDASLARLQTDYLDLYQCHRHDPETPLEETVRTMDDLIRRGKVLYWGFSQWPVEVISECLQLCDRRGYSRPISSQPQYSAISRSIEPAVMPLCHRNGIGQVVYSPIAQGVLTGKYKPGQPLPKDSRAADDKQNQFIKGMVSDHQLLERVQKLIPLTQEANLTMSQLALAWVLRRPEISSAIIGATKPEQVEENAKASDVKLPENILKQMDTLLAPN